ncbi:carbohydrate ABC transporter permease [Cellulomonas dongxiuzhuiae]|uniref:Carbohydrate ABC transporter permease n=1 Tax=Cellulomonas dongxiuzhuiae TaxID=2819979 RepID=A0ABX8GJP5_9CELL|nr:carbohydrate ABC transporter permease [Cellulomonas dongxiuzhuiae]MBO3087893.1 carbohydrate ABC transporter permease [Cellulomonas dongxiuzhuiae]MBO3094758.1 carbohydrate ABC transporter permease [Cellulomonas dongxiuzhuiae]QWC15756.1 carbohydrate ABC transporter permease [Cellulomonas dongxiuzhuiae]
MTAIPPTTLIDPGEVDTRKVRGLTRAEQRAIAAKGRLSSPWASGIAIVLAILWTVPTFGLLVTSFRPRSEIRTSGWWTYFGNPMSTLENYTEVLFGSSTSFATFFVNSLVITLPAVVIPISLALLAAYAFAWIPFRGREVLFVAVFALQVVPIQVTLLPLLQQYVSWGLAGSFWVVWLSHSIFALPLAIYLLHNFMKDIPASLVEAARVDGAGHVTVFFRVLLPLLTPAIASFGIFQFLWVWNDLLVALVFVGGTTDVAPLTVRIAELAGTRGSQWHLLSAGAFVAMVVPLVVFLALQRYFVRGLLAGSVKG